VSVVRTILAEVVTMTDELEINYDVVVMDAGARARWRFTHSLGRVRRKDGGRGAAEDDIASRPASAQPSPQRVHLRAAETVGGQRDPALGGVGRRLLRQRSGGDFFSTLKIEPTTIPASPTRSG
jgi:hypothetical protein